ncbi:hypothetical protein QGN29_14315 [Temperatibacter marinus]|uniref:DUF4375 domain-containing protein n=1 Tax=Temperatibacter marinus TaxID=1456591 RepID=A0AA52H9N8_9PROT|nr:hypothetical protein [Temperatibacter marinus]WND02722.1 hypothetical protein QGN29_14315 [Temperatibacter marinus]
MSKITVLKAIKLGATKDLPEGQLIAKAAFILSNLHEYDFMNHLHITKEEFESEIQELDANVSFVDFNRMLMVGAKQLSPEGEELLRQIFLQIEAKPMFLSHYLSSALKVTKEEEQKMLKKAFGTEESFTNNDYFYYSEQERITKIKSQQVFDEGGLGSSVIAGIKRLFK